MEKISTAHFMENTAGASPGFVNAGRARHVHCGRCNLRTQCFGCELPQDLLREFEPYMQTRHVPRGAQAYRGGADFHAIYFIREGAFKNQVRNARGDQFIVGFALPGDVMGLEGCADGYYISQPVALQDSEICELPYQELQALSVAHPGLRNILQLLIGRALARAQQERILLGRLSAEERLWSFLQEIALQLTAPDAMTCSFELPMTREDIADFLGLKMETVSRAFHKLQAAGFLKVHRRHIRLTMRPDS